MNATTTKKLGQVWILCPFNWGLDECLLKDLVTTVTEQEERLILVEQSLELETGKIIIKPIHNIDLAIWNGN